MAADDEDVLEEDTAPALAGKGVPSGIALLNGEIEILTEKRLPHLDRGPVLAFAARSKGSGTEAFFALICENSLVPRSAMTEKYASIMSTGLIKLVSSGVVFWPPARAERFVLVYQNTMGKPLSKHLEESEGGLGWKQEKAIKSFIRPMVGILLDLHDTDMPHGSINMGNIFEGVSEEGAGSLILGDCLAVPPSYLQPRVFETIERAMIDPIGKGRGSLEDDIYAFGVCLAMVMRHRDPLVGLDDEEVLRQKIDLGSYTALTSKDRITGPILELMRGLLYDDRAQRWTIQEIQAWLDGNRFNTRQGGKRQKASRPIVFNGNEYFRTPLLAMDFEKNQAEAMQMIEGGELEQWVGRSLEDNAAKARLEQALDQGQLGARSAGYLDRLLSRVSVAIDPNAPVRFKGVNVHPEGFPYALAHTYILKRDIVPYIEIINYQLVMFWLATQKETKIDVGNIVSRFDSCRAFLRQNTMGYGIERCIYFLCPECPCLSEKLEGYYVRSPEDMMRALEVVSVSPKRPALFVDRHIAAFLSVKDRRDIDSYLSDLNAAEYHRKLMANIKIVATIQKRSRMEPFPGIAHWIADILDPAYERYHSRDLRAEVRKRVEKAKKAGDLGRIVAILDDYEEKKQDFSDFIKAMKEYTDLGAEEHELRIRLEKPHIFGKETGQEVAAIISGFLAGIIILAFAFAHFSKAGIF